LDVLVRVSTRKTNCHYLLQHHESFSLPLIITIIAHPMDLLLSYNEQLKEEKMENKVQYSSHLRYKLWRFGAVDAINNSLVFAHPTLPHGAPNIPMELLAFPTS
jgi:hypothetical protein